MQAIDILLFFCSFFFYSCALALLLNWLWVAMGSPTIVEGEKHAQGFCHTGKIFSFFGLWLASKFTEYEARKHAEIPAQVRAEIEGLNPYKAREILAEYIGSEQVGMMPIEAIHDNLYPILLEQHTPQHLNPYSPFGMCLPCTSFWFGLLGWFPLLACPFAGFWTLLGAFLFLPATIYQIAKIART